MNNKIQIQTTHRGATISFNESTEVWVAEVDGATITPQGRRSLADTRKAVDDFLDRETKHKKTFQRQTAIYMSWNKPETVEVTSLTPDSREAWITKTDDKGRKERSKVSLMYLFQDDEENRARVKEMEALRAEEVCLSTARETLKVGLKKANFK